MTVCIAAVHQPSRAIVTVSDLMLADEYSSRERGSLKVWPLTTPHRWYCLYADSPSAFSPIQRQAFMLLLDKEVPSLVDVKSAVELAYQMEIGHNIERDVLGPLAMSRQQFKDDGLSQLGPDIFARKVIEVESVQLPLQLLVFGFHGGAGNALAHIFSVNERGQCSERDMEGFFAIGTGSWAALGSLSAKPGFSYAKTVEEVIYDVCEAKFVSETSRYVGRDTFVFIAFEDGRECRFAGPQLERLRSVWKRNTKRSMPPAASKIISDGLKPWSKTD